MRPGPASSTVDRYLPILPLLFAITAASPASAGDYYFSNPAGGNWNNAANWDGGVVPVNGDNAFLPAPAIYSPYTVQFDGAYDSPGLNLLAINGSSFSSGYEFLAFAATLAQSGSSMYAVSEHIGDSGNGPGSYLQSGGSNKVSGSLSLGYSSRAVGYYNLSGTGALSAPHEGIGVGSALSGTGSVGNFVQSGGTNTVSGDLDLATGIHSNGSYTLGGTGLLMSFNQTIGVWGSGSFIQNNGNNTLSGDLQLGRNSNLSMAETSNGSYALHGGILAAKHEYIGGGIGVAGTFTQDGGNNGISLDLYVGQNAPFSSGTYQMSAGALSVGGDEYVANGAGDGTFTQSGGDHAITGYLRIGNGAFTTGTFNLQGGALRAAATVNQQTFNQTGGTATLGAVDGGGTISLNGPSVLNAVHLRQSSVWIGSGSLIKIYGAGTRSDGVSVVNALSIAGGTDAWLGKLDLTYNDLIVHATANTADAVLAQITNQIKTGRANGTWMGNGITSSTAPLYPNTGLAVIRNQHKDVNGILVPIYNAFDGQLADINTIIVKRTWNGDMNMDGIINFDDYFQINTGFLSNGALGGYRWGDLNFDGVINFDDYFLLNSAFLGQGNVVLSPSMTFSAVPEPGALVLLAAAVAACARRRANRERRQTGVNGCP